MSNEIIAHYFVYGRTADASRTWPIIIHTSQEGAVAHCDAAFRESRRQMALLESKNNGGNVSELDIEAEGKYDPWRRQNTVDCDSIYFATTCYLVTPTKETDPEAWNENLVEALRAEHAEQQLYVQGQEGG